MRELKFRVWDKQKKEWFPIKDGLVLVLNSEDTYLAFVTRQGLYRIPDTQQKGLGIDRWSIQQYTGLKDKNGREIYEGDIFKIKYLIHPINPYSEKHFHPVVCDIDGSWFCFGRPLSKILENRTVSAELVGNIHENPELLQ